VNIQKILVPMALATVLAPLACASVVVGSYSADNAVPFSNTATLGAPVYQEIYSAGAFSGPVSISSVSFTVSAGGAVDDVDYTVQFSTTPSAVGDDYRLTTGSDAQTFGTFRVAGSLATNYVLTFTGATPFTYNPSLGNLLMEMTFSNVSSTSCSTCVSWAAFQAGGGGGQLSRAVQTPYATTSDPYGLVTTFEVTDASSAPEPATAALSLCGLGLAAGFAHRRRRLSAR
jgi:hypothetical protein